MRPPFLILLTLCSLLLAGCTTTPASEPIVPGEGEIPSTWSDLPIMTRSACTGVNAILFLDGAAMRPYVPPNWTFTAPSGQERASILRVHAAGCADGRHLVLSTPMQPDEQSTHHHENPDVVLGIWSDDPRAVDDWTGAGFPARNATFDQTTGPTGAVWHVTAAEGVVVHLATADPGHPTTSTYRWPAPYAAGTDEIHWAWGHENASARPISLRDAAFGAGSPLPGIQTLPWSLQAWVGFDVSYRTGTPPAA